MTVERFEKMLARIRDLGNMPLDEVRARVYAETISPKALIEITREQGWKRGDCIRNIIEKEFSSDASGLF